MKSLIAVLAVLSLAGCAATPYAEYAKIHAAYATAQAAKYTAIGAVGVSGDTTAKVAAMFALQGAGQQGAPNIAAPKSTADSVREWAGILVPGLLQFSGQYYNTRLGMQQSDNATLLGTSTNETFLGMAGQIQAPAANLTIGGSGVIGAGSYSTDNHAIDGSYNPAPVDNSNQNNPVDNTDNTVTYPPTP
jgi:hypothetical protein